MTSATSVHAPAAVAAIRPVGPAARRAWRIGGSLLAVVALAYGALAAVNQVSHEERTLTYSYPATAVRAIHVDTDSGSVRVVGGSRTTVSVELHVSDGLGATDHSQRLAGNRLSLGATCPVLISNFCRADYTIHAPRSVRVVARSSHGDVTVDGTDGGLDLSSDHGDVTATDVRAATVHASSDHGDVELTLVSAPRRVDAQSGNGDVTVVVPDVAEGYRVEGSSDHGSVHNEVRTDPQSNRVIVARSDNGDVTVTSPGNGA